MSRLQNVLKGISRTPNYAGINNLTKGIEKESLRVTPNGNLTRTPHPLSLGSALTHPYITTDYCESMLEFITEPSIDSKKVLTQLEQLQAFGVQNLKNEWLWPTSMPCNLGEDSTIPAAHYGSSNSGKLKSIYRLGLGHRYGRSLTIAGLHYNFSVSDELWLFLHKENNSTLSLQDFKTEGYLKLIRNFLRHSWLILYLHGASPCTSRNFLRDKSHDLQAFNNDQNTLHMPFATSLRMSDIGFNGKAQRDLHITYNNVNNYINALCGAIKSSHQAYSEKGVKDSNGNHRQLSDNLLQIENEYYDVIRPKRTPNSGENGLNALANKGIEYVEVRCIDLNPFSPLGIDLQQTHFLDVFLLYCLLENSPALTIDELKNCKRNQQIVACDGRNKNVTLTKNGKHINLKLWAQEIFTNLKSVANTLDQSSNSQGFHHATYSESLNNEFAKIDNPSLTPSAKLLNSLDQQQLSFVDFSMKLSKHYNEYFLRKTPTLTDNYADISTKSVQRQKNLESKKEIDFEEYLKNYLSDYTQLFRFTQAEQ